MGRIASALIVVLGIAALLSGCAIVECKREYPGLQKNAPQAVIKQENSRQGNISSYIRGFYTKESMRPDEIKLVTPRNYSNGQSIAKILFTCTPYGLMTLPFADIKGNKISVPLSRLGIAIQRQYYKEHSRKKLIYAPPGGIYYVNNKSTVIDKKKSISGDQITEGTIYEVDYEELLWEDVIWANIEKSSTYVLDLSNSKLYDNKRIVIGGTDMPAVCLPVDRSLVQEKKIIGNSMFDLGNRAYFSADGSLVIEDGKGKTIVIPKTRR